MRRHSLAAVSAGLLALAAVGCSAQTSKRDGDGAFGERVHAYILAHPEVIEEAVQALEAKRDAAAAAAAGGAIRLHLAALEHDASDPRAGDAAGTVTMIEFFDYRCPYCKVAAPAMPGFLAAHPNVRLIFKEFPILSAESEKAARLALAANLQGKYWPVHQALMKLPVLNDATIETTLHDAGVDVARAKADASTPAITAKLKDTHALADTLAINGTPSFVVGGAVYAGWLPNQLDAAIKTAAKSQKPE